MWKKQLTRRKEVEDDAEQLSKGFLMPESPRVATLGHSTRKIIDSKSSRRIAREATSAAAATESGTLRTLRTPTTIDSRLKSYNFIANQPNQKRAREIWWKFYIDQSKVTKEVITYPINKNAKFQLGDVIIDYEDPYVSVGYIVSFTIEKTGLEYGVYFSYAAKSAKAGRNDFFVSCKEQDLIDYLEEENTVTYLKDLAKSRSYHQMIERFEKILKYQKKGR